MSTIFWNTIKYSPALLGASLLVANSAYGAPSLEESSSEIQVAPQELRVAQATSESNSEILKQINIYNNEGTNVDSIDQVTSVSQLRDVSPGDWAYEALRSLVERYGCIAGYPNRTFRGNRATTRYEFAAGLNACLNQIERLIAASTADFITREDLETLQRLIQEFEAELATLGARVDNLEGRVAFLEDHQFSTTTKLKGEVIFTFAGAFGEEQAEAEERLLDDDDEDDDDDQDGIDENITFSNRVRLVFDTSFTGKDRLRTRLEAGNFTSLAGVTGTDMARLGHDAGGGNDVEITDLYYRFPIGKKFRAYLGTAGLDLDDIFDPTNPFLESSGSGALSRFNRRNPVTYRGPEGAGGGFTYKFSDALSLSLLYLADGDDAPSPAQKDGLFNGAYSAGAQLGISPIDNLEISLTYVRSYQPGGDVNLSGSTGSSLAKEPFGEEVATSANRFGAQASFRLTSQIHIGGWFGYIDAIAEDDFIHENGEIVEEGDNADIFTWAANLSFIDLGKEGAVFSIAGGVPPRATEIDGTEDEDDDISYLIEAQYKFPITKNILITPGAYVIFNPNHDDGNDTIWVGAIRTTFKF
ncbi:iron uptake porin [Moorena producens JHB]|uniref:Iron uptake porin n=1 Tax=Moorena producens (strain JHB) TaxID=1454205 RepID=A0A1D9G8Y5_MOOP1|nr:iron uptake porin [Moorena producens]AOY83850.2 iron uptake porin [Moorena producens JHB]